MSDNDIRNCVIEITRFAVEDDRQLHLADDVHPRRAAHPLPETSLENEVRQERVHDGQPAARHAHADHLPHAPTQIQREDRVAKVPRF